MNDVNNDRWMTCRSLTSFLVGANRWKRNDRVNNFCGRSSRSLQLHFNQKQSVPRKAVVQTVVQDKWSFTTEVAQDRLTVLRKNLDFKAWILTDGIAWYSQISMLPLPKTYNLQQTRTNDKPNKLNEPVKLFGATYAFQRASIVNLRTFVSETLETMKHALRGTPDIGGWPH